MVKVKHENENCTAVQTKKIGSSGGQCCQEDTWPPPVTFLRAVVTPFLVSKGSSAGSAEGNFPRKSGNSGVGQAPEKAPDSGWGSRERFQER